MYVFVRMPLYQLSIMLFEIWVLIFPSYPYPTHTLAKDCRYAENRLSIDFQCQWQYMISVQREMKWINWYCQSSRQHPLYCNLFWKWTSEYGNDVVIVVVTCFRDGCETSGGRFFKLLPEFSGPNWKTRRSIQTVLPCGNEHHFPFFRQTGAFSQSVGRVTQLFKLCTCR